MLCEFCVTLNPGNERYTLPRLFGDEEANILAKRAILVQGLTSVSPGLYSPRRLKRGGYSAPMSTSAPTRTDATLHNALSHHRT